VGAHAIKTLPGRPLNDEERHSPTSPSLLLSLAMSSNAHTPHSAPTQVIVSMPDTPGVDTPGVQERSSYIYSSETIQSRPTTMGANEKYDSKDHARHIEQSNQVDFDDELDHITEFPNKWAKIR
jgi:hypothetical protein